MRNHVGGARDAIAVDIHTNTAASSCITCLLIENPGGKIGKLGLRLPSALRHRWHSNRDGTEQATEDNDGHETCSNAWVPLHHCKPGCRATMPLHPPTVNLAWQKDPGSPAIAKAGRWL